MHIYVFSCILLYLLLLLFSMITIKNIFQWVISCLLSVLLFTAVWFSQTGIDTNAYTKLQDWYAIYSNNVMYRQDIIKDSDAASFVILWDWYWKDILQVYHNWSILTGKDAASFTYLWLWFAKDKDQVYINWSLLTWADSASFDLVQIVRDLKDIDDEYEMYPKINKLDTLLIVAEDKNNTYDRYGNIIDQTALEKIQKEEKTLYGKWQWIYKTKYPWKSVIVDFWSNNKIAWRWCNINVWSTYYLLSYNIIHIWYKWWAWTEKWCPSQWLLDSIIWTYSIEFINDTEFVLKSLKTNEIQFIFKKENLIDTTTRHFKNITQYIPYIIKSIFKKDPNLIYFVVWALGIGIFYLMRYFFRKKVSKK